MGQAKQRGSRDDRIAQAESRAQIAPKMHSPKSGSIKLPQSMADIARLQHALGRLVDNLTTPAEINDQVILFAKTLSDQEPVFLECKPEPWSRQSCCDANVAKYIEHQGGKILCGYRIWYNSPLYIEGERHAVWTDGDVIRDVSFVDTGETQVLFVPDDQGFDDASPKVRFAFNDEDKGIVSQIDAMERTIPKQRMSPEKAWEVMPSYEQWLAGKRMPNLFATLG